MTVGSNSAAKEAAKIGVDYFKANIGRINTSARVGEHDYHLHLVELQTNGALTSVTMAAFVALCSAITQKPIQSQMVVLGNMSLGGNVKSVRKSRRQLANGV
ncbi:putative ATP-dependent Lon-type protease [Pararhizobium capsulatum DSM 1112]|uniref:ATP-dependent Lon-type protease n=1 Tax=Pararhizobium capsulatum DSM 1112 TaxID=1121113 RepID=A0ABU0BL80_9HYPH|nr:S16 family serine protease [Pararhizobium capsulatum]MDQ0319000.1 putative ATP-dependent Lon-type protease [Pararhizobium capsulatum DSM 1112]